MRSPRQRPPEGGQRTIFRRESDYWTIAYEGSVLRLKDAKGLRYLEQLLREPGRSFHVADLIPLAADRHSSGASRSAMVTGAAIERARKSVTNRIHQTIARIRTADERLGLHLSNAVRTGERCGYQPERPVRWETSPVVAS